MLFNFRAILQNSWAEVMDLILKPRSGGENKNNLKKKKKGIYDSIFMKLI